MQLRTYRVCTPILGVCATTKCFVSIPPDTVLVVKRDRNPDHPYVSVQWDSYELLVFPLDLAERTVECVVPPKSAA
jgi:hypothetical protein